MAVGQLRAVLVTSVLAAGRIEASPAELAAIGCPDVEGFRLVTEVRNTYVHFMHKGIKGLLGSSNSSRVNFG
jgi:hypothetical protein